MHYNRENKGKVQLETASACLECSMGQIKCWIWPLLRQPNDCIKAAVKRRSSKCRGGACLSLNRWPLGAVVDTIMTVESTNVLCSRLRILLS